MMKLQDFGINQLNGPQNENEWIDLEEQKGEGQQPERAGWALLVLLVVNTQLMLGIKVPNTKYTPNIRYIGFK